MIPPANREGGVWWRYYHYEGDDQLKFASIGELRNTTSGFPDWLCGDNVKVGRGNKDEMTYNNCLC